MIFRAMDCFLYESRVEVFVGGTAYGRRKDKTR